LTGPTLLVARGALACAATGLADRGAVSVRGPLAGGRAYLDDRARGRAAGGAHHAGGGTGGSAAVFPRARGARPPSGARLRPASDAHAAGAGPVRPRGPRPSGGRAPLAG